MKVKPIEKFGRWNTRTNEHNFPISLVGKKMHRKCHRSTFILFM